MAAASLSEELDLILKLLEDNATLTEMSQFLRRRKLPHSLPSWETLRKRVTKAIKQGQLLRRDLVELLRLSEEHGKQHIFLYRCQAKALPKLIDESKVLRTLKGMNLHGLLKKPRIMDKPDRATVVDVRWEHGGRTKALTVKVVEARRYRRFIDERPQGSFIIRRYHEETLRAVNLFRLCSDGLLELRIHSHINTTQYKGDVTRMWTMLSPLFRVRDFNELPLTRAKSNLWKNRSKLREILKYSEFSARNELGTRMTAATGDEKASLFDDDSAVSGLEAFMKSDAISDASNLWWLKQASGTPSKHIHMLISGSPNEFALTAKCSKEDYEHALEQLRRYNKQVS